MTHAADLGTSGRPVSRIPVCGWSPTPSDPTVPLCNQPAAMHIKPSDGRGLAAWSIFACTRHASLALAGAGDAHPVTVACSHQAAIWIQGTAFRTSGCARPRQTTTIGAHA